MQYTFNGSDPAVVTWFIISYLISMLVSMGITALMLVSSWHLFKKLGMPGWKGIIPFYSDYMLFRTVWISKPFWVLVIASGVYTAAAVLTAVLTPILFLLNGNNAGEEQILALLMLFLVIFGVVTLVYAVLALIISFKLYVRLARAFGKGIGYAFGLTFLTIVFYPILAFGKSQRVTEEVLQ